MRTRRSVAGLGLLGLTASVLIAVPAAADDPPDDVVLSNDFEDGVVAPWQQNGNPGGVTVVADPDDADNQVLSITDRAEGHDGVSLDLLAHFDPGSEIEIAATTKLPAGEPAASVNFAVERVVGGGTDYDWVGPNPTVTDAGWEDIGGTYTIPGDATAAKIYLQTTAGPHSDLYLDDIVVTGPAPSPAGPDGEVVWSLDFDDESHAPWTNNGGELSFVDTDDGGKALSITRAADHHGIKSPVGELTHDVQYTFSMRARLPEGTDGQRDVRFVVEPAYNWVANTPIDGDGWTHISGTYQLPADADPAASAIYIGTGDADPYTILIDDLLISRPAGPPGPITPVDLSFDFEDGDLDGWEARDGGGDPAVGVTDAEAHESVYAALVTERGVHGDGIGYDLTGTFETGVTYDVDAWVKMAQGGGTEDIWLSARTSSDGGEPSFNTVGQFTGITSGQWHEVSAAYTMTSADEVFLYFETAYPDGGTGDFLVDDITIRSREPGAVQDLLPIWERHEDHFPVGVAIDERETFGSAADLTTLHFNQVTAENHMKPDAFYDGANFRIHPEATAIMDLAQANDLAVYGHVLVWHSQIPDWFFQDAAGDPLTTSAEDQQILRDRMHDHIFDVAEAFAAAYGDYGSETNPLVAWDVVNEVVSDSGEFDDGLRRSEWYRILGEEYIDLAFEYADEAFNDEFAADGADRPVTLFINDYNTEQSGKQDRYLALIDRLVDRGVPIDGIGHQFHLNLSMPVSALETALVNSARLGLVQAVTEMDVTVGTPVTEANLIEQGYYYRDAFELFREHAEDLYAVTVWGLTDNRSWRSAQAPLAFDGDLQAKPAYYGIVDADLPARLRTADVFQGSVDIAAGATDAIEWSQLPLHPIEDVGSFQLRWEPDHLTAYVEVEDGTVDDDDAVEFEYQGTTVTIDRDGSSDADAVATEVDGGYEIVVHLELDPEVDEGETLDLDVRVTDGGDTAGWNTPGALGTLTLVEPLSYVEVVEAATAPTIDGDIDDVWDTANTVTTDKVTDGVSSGAVATVRTLWQDDTLYVLAEVADEDLDATGSDPWTQDSVEIYVDAGNYRQGPYRYDDTQIRINHQNQVSFGTGDEAFQEARLQSATSTVDGGYVVEAAIDLLEEGGADTFHGFDAQVNDASGGARTSIRNWADPTGLGYQSTSRWGVARLLATEPDPGEPEAPCDTTISGRHNGKLFATSGTTCLEGGADVRGGIWVGPGAGLVADGADVRGGVTAFKASRLELRDSTVRGGVTVTWGKGPIAISGNDVRGGVKLFANLTHPDRPVVSGNTIRGPLFCLGNVPAPTDDGDENHVTGWKLGQCWRM